MPRDDGRLPTERVPIGMCPIPLVGMVALVVLLFNLALKSKRR